ncbi:Prestin [Oryzias melastigma]|uniref:Prestin n=1 Tax=Oryzias melastigma TaxID=30732 RepID=A0A834CAH5_ORYME|nr:Prestin [Oryzias melastigma]
MEAEEAGAGEDAGSQRMCRIERPLYDEAFLRTQLLHRRENTTTFRQRLAEKFRCTSSKAKAVALTFLPFLTWLPSYPVKQYLFSDVVSGLSTAVVQLPQGLAYAMLAAVPPVYGLYSSFYPVVLYAFFGTSRHVSVGTFAVISLMIGGVAVREAPDTMFFVPSTNSSNNSSEFDLVACENRRVQVAVVLTTLVGIIQFVFGLLRFGFVAIYLTEPLVRGFTTAAAVHVVVSQLKYLLGVKTKRFSGPLSVIFCIVFLYVVKVLNERYKKKLPVPIPGEIIVVIVSTGVSYGMSLNKHYQVDVVNTIPTGLRPPAIPDFSLLPSMIPDAFAVAIVGFSMDISLAKIFALKHGYSVDGNQELIALGLSNFFGSFFQTFAVTSSMSRSLVQESTGGKTQISGLVASIIVLLVIVAIGFVFEPLPQTVLAAIIMVNLLGMFRQFRDIPTLWRTSKIELVIWLATFVASVLLGLDYGLLAAIALALLTVIYRTQSPKTSILGHVPNTGLYYDVDEYEEASEYEGIKIFSSNSSIYFANSDLYMNTLMEKTGVNPEKLKAAQKARKKQKEKTKKKESSPLTVAATYKDEAVIHEVLPQSDEAGEGLNGQLEDKHNSETTSEVAVFLEPLSDVHSIILDWTTTSFIDSVGAKAIKQIIREYAAVDVRVVIASCNRSTLADLDRLQFFSENLTPHLFFPTIHDAVLHCQHANSSPAGAANEHT